MSKNERIRIMLSIRLPRSLVERVDEWVKKQSPTIKDRTHAIEVALTNLIKPLK